MYVAIHAGELLPHRFTHHPDKRGWFIFCCTCRPWTLIQRPDVIRLAALRCSDFPLLRVAQISDLKPENYEAAITQLAHLPSQVIIPRVFNRYSR